MKLIDTTLELREIESNLEDILIHAQHNIIVCEDFDLSYKDYKCLALKLQRAEERWDSIAVLSEYRLCVVVTIIFAIKYDYEEKTAFQFVDELFGNLHQHQLRYALNMLSTVFLDYEFEDFDVDADCIIGFFVLAMLHAGIENVVFYDFYQMLEGSSVCKSMMNIREIEINNRKLNEYFQRIALLKIAK